MKTKILEIICSDKTDEKKFEELYPLFLATPYHNKGLAFRLNSQRVNKTTFSILVNELKKLYKISDIEIFKFKNQADKKDEDSKIIKLNPDDIEDDTSDEENEDDKDADGGDDDENSKDEDTSDEEQKSFRDEFPFLNDKDCPEELKILAADKITAFTKVSEGRKTLKAVADKEIEMTEDRKSTRLNSSHVAISYAVFCLKKKTLKALQSTLAQL